MRKDNVSVFPVDVERLCENRVQVGTAKGLEVEFWEVCQLHSQECQEFKGVGDRFKA